MSRATKLFAIVVYITPALPILILTWATIFVTHHVIAKVSHFPFRRLLTRLLTWAMLRLETGLFAGLLAWAMLRLETGLLARSLVRAMFRLETGLFTGLLAWAMLRLETWLLARLLVRAMFRLETGLLTGLLAWAMLRLETRLLTGLLARAMLRLEARLFAGLLVRTMLRFETGLLAGLTLKLRHKLSTNFLSLLNRKLLKLLESLLQKFFLLRLKLLDTSKVFLDPYLLSRLKSLDAFKIALKLLELLLAHSARFFSDRFFLLFRKTVPACKLLLMSQRFDNPRLRSVLRKNSGASAAEQQKHRKNQAIKHLKRIVFHISVSCLETFNCFQIHQQIKIFKNFGVFIYFQISDNLFIPEISDNFEFPGRINAISLSNARRTAA